MVSSSCLSLASAFALAASGACAQSPAPSPSAPGPGSGVAPVRLEFSSTLDGYRAFVEPAPLSWREANDVAGSLGGHVGQLRGRGPVARQPAGAAPLPATQAAPLPLSPSPQHGVSK